MKKLIPLSALALIALMVVSSCEKIKEINPFKKEKEKKEKPCPVVPVTSVPQPVIHTFKDHYPNANPKRWYNNNNNSYIAKFDLNGKTTKALIKDDGSFEKEIDNNSTENENHDGCDCDCKTNDD